MSLASTMRLVCTFYPETNSTFCGENCDCFVVGFGWCLRPLTDTYILSGFFLQHLSKRADAQQLLFYNNKHSVAA